MGGCFFFEGGGPFVSCGLRLRVSSTCLWLLLSQCCIFKALSCNLIYSLEMDFSFLCFF